ncbi:RagB/SusD family nutrient uptake outer membrane protein [Lacihabitans sp. CS3-21]|uniref:RagB/SusD family nutrient uptake outer membrane protein n=1 Tax=Lacihabitans sp. CS3-21 TaxID=2487332 RepID=UPI0020CD407C|nr:RagB/SusD family nutrient uptake outer membrane protein [Lacihabitans sp. CS3-21]MCP9746411.1 RagB/SusD family nutrient uptake outer membrane protein [Lacihabitans sp. CS3-21]
MKNLGIKAIIIFAITIFTYTSCNEKRIDLEPLSPTEASYFFEESDYNKSILGVYAKMTDIYWFNANNPIHGFWILPGDDITTSGTVPFEIFGTLQAANGSINTFYKVAYQIINRANIVLQKLDKEDGVIKTPNLKNNIRGEALFLKGYANFLLWNYFGNSPLVTERIESSDKTTPPNSKGNELLDEAIKNFSEAATLLPVSWNATNRGRATQSSANGFLGKALVFRGSVTKNTADFTEALSALNKIKDKKLVADFGDNFNSKTENNSESLFEFQASQPDFDNVWLSDDFQAGGSGSTSAYWGFYENHWSLFGAPRYEGTKKLAKAFDSEDPRVAATINLNDFTFNKYWNTGELKTQAGVGSANNPRILRYADILLLKAEATLESGGSTSTAIGYINEVRTRARNMKTGGKFPEEYLTTENDKSKIFNWINKERFLELAGEEGTRWLDLRRWHLAGKINLGANYDFSSLRNDVKFDVTKNLLYPIPLNELDLNPNVIQNKGY